MLSAPALTTHPHHPPSPSPPALITHRRHPASRSPPTLTAHTCRLPALFPTFLPPALAPLVCLLPLTLLLLALLPLTLLPLILLPLAWPSYDARPSRRCSSLHSATPHASCAMELPSRCASPRLGACWPQSWRGEREYAQQMIESGWAMVLAEVNLGESVIGSLYTPGHPPCHHGTRTCWRLPHPAAPPPRPPLASTAARPLPVPSPPPPPPPRAPAMCPPALDPALLPALIQPVEPQCAMATSSRCAA